MQVNQEFTLEKLVCMSISHAGNVGNENADKLAKAAAKLSLEGANPWTRVPPNKLTDCSVII